MPKKYILALDQGTTSSRAILFDRRGKQVCSKSRGFRQIYPKPGWVEHDPNEIWSTQIETARQVLELANVKAGQIEGIGITNQRETTIIWERESGSPIYNAIVWQCRRTANMCDDLKQSKKNEEIRKRTGLFIDAYFSATKVKWILNNVPGAYERALAGDLLFGTVDSWLVYNLTKERVHITDFSNASRTMVFNIFDKEWDKTILDILEIPYGILPQVRASSEFYGFSDPCLLGAEIPISGIAGDQQASLFGQTCFERGSAKNTYGTGCFMLLNIGEDPILSKNGLITTIAWGINGDVEYALEGSIFIGGAVIAWLRDGLGIIKSVGESESLALSVEDNGGVYLVPAFAGLGAPHWDMYARGTVFGLTGGTSRSHIVRAALESIAYQTRDVMECMEGETGLRFKQLKVDGGAIANRFLMQFQADILGIPVICAGSAETTAQGAAYLAGLAVGFWKNQSELSERWRAGRIFQPEMESDRRQLLHGQWEKALERTKYWLTE